VQLVLSAETGQNKPKRLWSDVEHVLNMSHSKFACIPLQRLACFVLELVLGSASSILT